MYIVVELAGGGSLAAAVGVSVAVDVAVAVAVGLINFSSTIFTRRQILWSPVCGILGLVIFVQTKC